VEKREGGRGYQGGGSERRSGGLRSDGGTSKVGRRTAVGRGGARVRVSGAPCRREEERQGVGLVAVDAPEQGEAAGVGFGGFGGGRRRFRGL
jgi:hypothetical protein